MLRVTTTDLDRIGGLIRSARKHRGLTQTQLAEVLGTSQSAVHRIEAGNQNLSLEMVNRIAAALDSPRILGLYTATSAYLLRAPSSTLAEQWRCVSRLTQCRPLVGARRPLAPDFGSADARSFTRSCRWTSPP